MAYNGQSASLTSRKCPRESKLKYSMEEVLCEKFFGRKRVTDSNRNQKERHVQNGENFWIHASKCSFD